MASSFLIDTGPDLRQQALRENIERMDAVFTPTRIPIISTASTICAPTAITSVAWCPCSANAFTLDNIQQRFSLCVFPPSQYWDKTGAVRQRGRTGIRISGITVTPIPVMHGTLADFTATASVTSPHITDVSEIP